MEVIQIAADGDTTTPEAAEQLRESSALYDPDQFTANVYLVLGDRPVLVDAGTSPGVESVVGEYTDTLDAVVLTHGHGDHVGELDAVLDTFETDCYAFGSHPRATHELSDGDRVRLGDASFDVLHTPGHAPDHVVFLSDTTLFAGDLVVPNDQAFDYGSFGATGGPGAAREQLIDSLERLLDQLSDDVEHLYAGHGDAYHGDVRDLVETALERASERVPKYRDQ